MTSPGTPVMTEGQNVTKKGQWAANSAGVFAVEVATGDKAQLRPISTADMYAEMQSEGDEKDRDEDEDGIPVYSKHRAHAHPPTPDLTILNAAIEDLTMHLKAKTLNVIFRGRIVSMLSFLQF